MNGIQRHLTLSMASKGAQTLSLVFRKLPLVGAFYSVFTERTYPPGGVEAPTTHRVFEFKAFLATNLCLMVQKYSNNNDCAGPVKK